MKTLGLLLLALATGPAQAGKSLDIFDAARQGDMKTITKYIHQGGDINIYNQRAHTPFILATYYGHNTTADLLLKNGADACALDEKGSNAYMGVAFKGHIHTARWLLENTNCPINHRNYAGQTALMMASLFGQDDVVELFMQSGADPDIVDHQGNTAISLAAGQGLTHILNMIRFPLQ